ncbi:MAG: hypothetical protein DYG89_25405 [Caldilinea sp. CFX5]|nr:hypothetical protein [Caldilinea sp. CFX5]
MNATNAKLYPWLLLFGRTFLALGIQALFAFGFYLGGAPQAWEVGAAWWPLGVTLVNLICLAAMVLLVRNEGGNYWTIFRIQRGPMKSDLMALAVILLITGPVSYLPNILLGNALFGDVQQTLTLLVRPLPMWAAVVGVLFFPITQGLVELPLYFRYVLPRLQRQGVYAGLAVALSALMLGLQHATMPFLFDSRFILWRGLMFLPFAFLVAIVLAWRPRLLPYLAIVHVLLDLAFAAMLLGVAI